MRFKRIYVEITNVCNLNCSFCLPHHREPRFMKLSEFEGILNKISDYSEYIYLHVKGEPLLHPAFDALVKLAYDKGFKINLTTNGTLLSEHLNITKYLHQINISLHATNDLKIIKLVKNISDCKVCIRLWTIDEDSSMIKKLEKEFNTSIPNVQNFKLTSNIFLSQMDKFKWPSLNDAAVSNGYCYGLKTQLAILVDGSVVPCCLDNEGDITLGNIFIQNLDTILSSKRACDVINGFKNRVAIETLCQKCTYKNRFD